MINRRRALGAALGLFSLSGLSLAQQPAVTCTQGVGMLSQRMGKAWLCLPDMALAERAEAVLRASELGFEQQLLQQLQKAASPEQAGSLRALRRRYEDYKALLASTPGPETHRELLNTASELLTLAQLGSAPRGSTPWQAHLAARQRMLSQRVALLALAAPSGPGADAVRRERQAAVYEFEAGLQTLRRAPGGTEVLRERLARAETLWQPLRSAVTGSGQPQPVFVASEQLLTVLDEIATNCQALAA